MFEKLKAQKALKLLSDPKVLDEVLKSYKSPEFDKLLKERKKYDNTVKEVKGKRKSETYDTSKLFFGPVGYVNCRSLEGGRYRLEFDKRKLAVLELIPDSVARKLRYDHKIRYYDEASNYYNVISEDTLTPHIDSYIYQKGARSVWGNIRPLSDIIDVVAHPVMTKDDIIRFEKYILNGKEKAFVTDNGDEIELE